MIDILLFCFNCVLGFIYEMDVLLVCFECGYEWLVVEVDDVVFVVCDSVGNVLVDGDDVIVIKDFKVKGLFIVVKVGVKVCGIWIVDGDYDIDCKVLGIGKMGLKF